MNKVTHYRGYSIKKSPFRPDVWIAAFPLDGEYTLISAPDVESAKAAIDYLLDGDHIPPIYNPRHALES